MCGISGELRIDGGPANAAALTRMTDAIRHRGPDHGATYCGSGMPAGLAFRRLSIIDLREAANQPIPNEDGSIQLVFNGEIYNFRELRAGLVARGHQFRSNGDAEVIAHLFEEKGERAIDDLDGMFALGIWNTRTGQLTLARDRVGKKPLYLYRDATRVVFASEIKALLRHPDVTTEIDAEAIPYYLLYGYVPHPQTFYTRITQIDPGTVVTIGSDGQTCTRRYWHLQFPDEATRGPGPSFESAAATVRQLVTEAVERRLISDVPLGAFLSGGIDSTIVVAMMSRAMSEPVRTFSIGFEGDPAFDETGLARETARQFNTRHTEFRVKPSAIELIDTLVYHHDGPFADSSAIPTYLVSKLTREHVTVVLTGDGGDEAFAGYLRFGAALAAEKFPEWAGAIAAGASGLLPSPANERHPIARVKRFARHMSQPLQDRLTAWMGVFNDDLLAVLGPALRDAGRAMDRRRHLRGLTGIDGASPLNQLLAANFHSYLHDDLLVKADRMSMANSLEARAPFLDRALLEYAAALPDDHKLRGRTTKAVLRAAFADVIPAAVQSAPKRGFGVPLDAWFRSDLREYVADTLLSPAARSSAYLSRAFVQELVDTHQRGHANNGHKLWTLLTFERWLALLPEWRAA
ncbi:MAG TPA: asparagine synthase (glutamine-hydrolyzing) [Vicinamibacterales bacterium]|nr:asparagine synthase (glutamine-hydrolyzing) [Vicinamibacterales bacterium]